MACVPLDAIGWKLQLAASSSSPSPCLPCGRVIQETKTRVPQLFISLYFFIWLASSAQWNLGEMKKLRGTPISEKRSVVYSRRCARRYVYARSEDRAVWPWEEGIRGATAAALLPSWASCSARDDDISRSGCVRTAPLSSLTLADPYG
jgi:hypothetical protein